MIRRGIPVCPKCGGELKYFDMVKRSVLTKGRVLMYLEIRRFKCKKCDGSHRELPSFIYPYKHYEAELINGVLEGYITPDTLGFENFPCEATMIRWKSQKIKNF
jgi:hypothetical protein